RFPCAQSLELLPPTQGSLPGGWLILTGAGFSPTRINDLARPHCELFRLNTQQANRNFDELLALFRHYLTGL
ncbi:MAG: hypothetical protein Q9M20_02890, partial [Mariprofundaceae bacterium]|nr:hypothetical protein [Mariprofundaceae bacterium]